MQQSTLRVETFAHRNFFASEVRERAILKDFANINFANRCFWISGALTFANHMKVTPRIEPLNCIFYYQSWKLKLKYTVLHHAGSSKYILYYWDIHDFFYKQLVYKQLN